MSNMIVLEKQLSKMIKDKFHLKTILLESEGIIEGHISFINAVCKYNHKNGILYIFKLLNNIRIDVASQYKIIYEEENKVLKIKLDNGQNIKLTVLKK